MSLPACPLPAGEPSLRPGGRAGSGGGAGSQARPFQGCGLLRLPLGALSRAQEGAWTLAPSSRVVAHARPGSALPSRGHWSGPRPANPCSPGQEASGSLPDLPRTPMRQGVSLCQANKCKRPLGGSLEADHCPHTVLGPGCDSLAVWPLRWREGHLCLHAASMCTCSTRVVTQHPCIHTASVCTPSVRVYA